MYRHPDHTIYPLGNAGLVISFGDQLDENIYLQVLSAYQCLRSSATPVFTDIVPAYTSVSVLYDLAQASGLPGNGSIFSRICVLIEELLSGTVNRKDDPQRKLRVPVCYEDKFAPDLAEMAALSGLSREEIIEKHTSRCYKVFMLGFLPGFAYMGTVNERIRFPRKKTPRTLVEAGSVGIAGQQTGIYPFDSPGGWQIIGKTPLVLFDVSSGEPAFFQPGDEVEFFPISEYEFENY